MRDPFPASPASVSSRRRRDAAVLGLPTLAAILLHLPFLEKYGWFRDELYYVVCGLHPAFGYVDHPPLVAWIARAVWEISGESHAALRLLSVLNGAAVVFLAGWTAREMGGGRFAQELAAVCALTAPVYLFMFHTFSMNPFDVLFWTLGAFVLARILRTGNGRLWLLFGLITGLGLLNKHSILFFGFGVAAGLLLTPERRHLREPWIWLGGAIAAALALPHLLWQIRNGWPTAEFIHNATTYKNVALSPVAFLVEQVMQMNPFAALVWVGGLGWLLLGRSGRPFRLLGWMYVAAFVVLVSQSSKAYYLAPAYPVLFAAGGTALEAGLRQLRQGWLRPALAGALLVLVLAGGAIGALLVVPILSIPDLIRYQHALGIQPSAGERQRLGDLPQHFADMHGWPAMVAEVDRVYRSLPPEEQEKAGIFGQNYGEAGAIDVLGRAQGLPPATSGHNNYFLWGPHASGEVLIVLGGDEEDNRRVCPRLEKAGTVRCDHCMPYEDDLPVWICRGVDLQGLWPELKEYI
ncbi:MAG TPA: glycosyltransferase family 39 protein [Thermoanaerobaculia bacterium]|nr:glycosyltransferase family 39 protein [Thermoanaerobaculia bacterium]